MINIFFKKILPLFLLIGFYSASAEVASVNGKNISKDLVDFIKSEVKNKGDQLIMQWRKILLTGSSILK